MSEQGESKPIFRDCCRDSPLIHRVGILLFVATNPTVSESRSLERFERMVDRSGEHHLWLGAKDPQRGTGRVKLDGKVTTAHRAAWELVNGPLAPGAKVLVCSSEPACVRVEHLRLVNGDASSKVAGRPRAGRGRKGSGSMREVRPGVWTLTVTAGEYEDGRPRRRYRQVRVANAAQAARELAAFVTEARAEPHVVRSRQAQSLTFDEAVEQYLAEYLTEEKGREERTVADYRELHRKWFSPHIGDRLVRDVNDAMMDRLFGRMRRAGLSRSRLNHAESLYAPFFRWAARRRIVNTNPMLGFQLPTSSHVPRQHTPPEVEELSILLREAVDVVPDVAPLLALGAVTGMRRGELVGIRRSRVLWDELQIIVDAAVDERKKVKGTKTRKERSFHVDGETMAMLRRHCDLMDERAAECGVRIGPDAFVFSLAPDCSEPLGPHFLTNRVGHLKDHLGISEKSPETIALQDEALRLFRLPPQPRPLGSRGLPPRGGLPMQEIGRRLGRSDRWAGLAVRAAELREAAAQRPVQLNFDGSVLALRKFTSSELLDAGFNISVVAQRQGHGPQVLVDHYSKSRRSADRRAAEHLGRVVHASSNREVDADET